MTSMCVMKETLDDWHCHLVMPAGDREPLLNAARWRL